MSKFFKLENDDNMDVWVPRADIAKVNVTCTDEQEGKEWFDVHVVDGNNDEEIYEMCGPIGSAAELVSKLEIAEYESFHGRHPTLKV